MQAKNTLKKCILT